MSSSIPRKGGALGPTRDLRLEDGHVPPKEIGATCSVCDRSCLADPSGKCRDCRDGRARSSRRAPLEERVAERFGGASLADATRIVAQGRECKIAECPAEVALKGFCRPHYTRIREAVERGEADWEDAPSIARALAAPPREAPPAPRRAKPTPRAASPASSITGPLVLEERPAAYTSRLSPSLDGGKGITVTVTGPAARDPTLERASGEHDEDLEADQKEEPVPKAKLENRTCELASCGKTYAPKRKDQRFHAPACRKEALNAARPRSGGASGRASSPAAPKAPARRARAEGSSTATSSLTTSSPELGGAIAITPGDLTLVFAAMSALDRLADEEQRLELVIALRAVPDGLLRAFIGWAYKSWASEEDEDA